MKEREKGRLTIVLQAEEIVCDEDGDVGEDGEDPGEEYQQPHIPHSPGGEGADRMDDCQVPVSQDKDKLRTTTDCEPPVCCHEDQGVDGDIRRDVDDVLDCPAPG